MYVLNRYFWNESKRLMQRRQFHDITELLNLCTRRNLSSSAIILNDQLGRGRSSTTAVIVLLIQRWLKEGRNQKTQTPRTPSRSRPPMLRKLTTAGGSARTSWQIINSCLRVIRNGLDVKQVRLIRIVTISVGADREGCRSWMKLSMLQLLSSTFERPSKTFMWRPRKLLNLIGNES